MGLFAFIIQCLRLRNCESITCSLGMILLIINGADPPHFEYLKSKSYMRSGYLGWKIVARVYFSRGEYVVFLWCLFPVCCLLSLSQCGVLFSFFSFFSLLCLLHRSQRGCLLFWIIRLAPGLFHSWIAMIKAHLMQVPWIELSTIFPWYFCIWFTYYCSCEKNRETCFFHKMLDIREININNWFFLWIV